LALQVDLEVPGILATTVAQAVVEVELFTLLVIALLFPVMSVAMEVVVEMEPLLVEAMMVVEVEVLAAQLKWLATPSI
jgi:hypothetical protein